LAEFPLSALPWLRQKMVKISVENDGTKRIDKAPTIPKWVTMSGSGTQTATAENSQQPHQQPSEKEKGNGEKQMQTDQPQLNDQSKKSLQWMNEYGNIPSLISLAYC
jgi:hypothetical protein